MQFTYLDAHILHVVLQDWTSAVNLLIDSCSKLARQELSRVRHLYSNLLSSEQTEPALQAFLQPVYSLLDSALGVSCSHELLSANLFVICRPYVGMELSM